MKHSKIVDAGGKPFEMPVRDKTDRYFRFATAIDDLTLNTSFQNINSWIRTNLKLTRDICRVHSVVNPYLTQTVRVVPNQVVGQRGVMLSPNARTVKGEADQLLNVATLDAWKKFSKAKYFDVAGQRSRMDIEKYLTSQYYVDGEAFVRIRKGPQYEYGLSVQLIDPALCPINFYQDEKDNRVIVAGIEYDADTMRPTRYFFYNKSDKIASKFHTSSQMAIRADELTAIPADQICHVYKPIFANQARGIPGMAAAIVCMHHHDHLQNASVISARIGASNMLLLEQEDGGGIEFTGDDETEDGTQVFDIKPGSADILPKGVKVSDKGWQPAFPATMYEALDKSILMKAASAIGLSYSTFTGDYSDASFSAARLGSITERETFIDIQNMIISTFEDKLYEAMDNSTNSP